MPKIFQVDAFTTDKYKGNPAAVCLIEKMESDQWMQSVAAEMNLSETAFVLRLENGFGLRWFTPKVEVDLCGHATLATAHILWEQRFLKEKEKARFHTRSGILTATKNKDWIDLDFPAEPAKEEKCTKALKETLKVEPVYVGKNRFDYLVQVNSEKDVLSLEPDFFLLEKITERGIIVTSLSTSSKYDFVSRFFAPAAGIDEDPVTGSAHCCLGPFWKDRLHKSDFIAYQASPRGGFVKVKVRGDRVILGGQAVTVLKGELV